jgi:aspartate/methionine/tyrosine aminotransferase
METDIEWLFEEIYKLRERIPEKDLFFVSDWDSDIESDNNFNEILNNAQSRSKSSFFKYSFAYEQFGLKSQILEFVRELYNLQINKYSVTITPSATQSIYLSLLALKRLNVNRYLVFTPAYFSTFESLKSNNSFIHYYHLLDSNGFSIDFVKLEEIIKQQYIECIILTDPVFSAGIEFADQEYKSLAGLAKLYNLYLIVDYSLGGLSWDIENLSVLNHNKLKALLSADKYIFIDSLSKRLLLNGIKFSLVFAHEDVIDNIDLAAEGIFGGLNSIQVETIRQLYMPENNQAILEMQKKQLNKIKANYNLINSLLKDHPFILAGSNSGIFTTVSSTKVTFSQVNTKELVLQLLTEDYLIIIPNNRFSYYPANKFGWRVNLAKNQSDILPALVKCVRKISGRLNR